MFGKLLARSTFTADLLPPFLPVLSHSGTIVSLPWPVLRVGRRKAKQENMEGRRGPLDCEPRVLTQKNSRLDCLAHSTAPRSRASWRLCAARARMQAKALTPKAAPTCLMNCWLVVALPMRATDALFCTTTVRVGGARPCRRRSWRRWSRGYKSAGLVPSFLASSGFASSVLKVGFSSVGFPPM